MKYNLALDIGVGSIGTSVIELDKKDNRLRLVDAGVRIFEVSEGAETRRTNRSTRKNLRRTAKRLNLLAKKLFENGLWVNPDPAGTKKMRKISPYQIRRNALYEKLENPNYIGRAILHMAKHRGAGWLSEENQSKDEIIDETINNKKNTSPFDKLYKEMQKNNVQTVGEYLWTRLKNHKAVRQKTKYNPVNYRIPRYLLKEEFNKIWDKQAKYFDQMRADGLKNEVFSILFFERPSVPYAIGKCIYYTDEDRLSTIHPLAEMRRIYEEVNNLRVINIFSEKRHLTIEERDKIINELLLRGENAGKRNIKKILNVEVDIDKSIKAFLYSTSDFQNINYLQHCSKEDLEQFSEFVANPVNPCDKEGRLYTEAEFIEVLKNKYKIGDEQEIGKLLSKLPKGRRGSLGKTATNKILEKLKEKVISHREATDELKKYDEHFRAVEELYRENQGKYNELPYYGEILRTYTQSIPPFVLKNNNNLNDDEKKFGKVANPGVHRILNQIRLVVNEVIRHYGRPHSINIELGRDVGLSEEQKKSLEKIQKDNEKKNEEAKNYLKERNIKITSTNILKYKLAKEQNFIDIYNATVMSQKFEGMEIDHIIPREKGGSDTFNNLCLANSNNNNEKDNMFPYNYFKNKKSPEEFREIMKKIREIYQKNPGKLWRFEEDAEKKFRNEGDNDETNRYLTDTRYVTKLAQQYLRAILNYEHGYDDVVHTRILAVRGKETARLRKYWNLEGLEYELMGLDIPKYLDNEKENRNKEWFSKPRIDHRHHAMDAIVLGCATRSLLQKMQRDNDFKVNIPLSDVKSINEFRKKVIGFLKNIKISHKPERSKSGELHKATKRTVVHKNDKSVFIVYRRAFDCLKSVKDLNKLIVNDKFLNEWNPEIKIDREKQFEFQRNILNYLDKSKQILEEENKKKIAEGKSGEKITEAKIIKKAIDVLIDEGKWKERSFRYYEESNALIFIKRHNAAYESGNNYCMDFFQKSDGKVGWELINRFNANNPDFKPEWQKQKENKPLWYVCISDLLELDTPEEWKRYTNNERCLARVKKMTLGELSIDYISDARMTSPPKKEIKYMHVDTLNRGLKFFAEHNARKIELTPFGKIKRKHKKLWSGEK